ncbi:UNVERIFIED_ORG: biotin carboxylase [Rahnella aquatilis]
MHIVYLDKNGYKSYNDVNNRNMFISNQHSFSCITVQKRVDEVKAWAKHVETVSDLDNEEEVLSALLNINRYSPVNRVFSLAEKTQLLAALCREKLNIPGIKRDVIDRFRDKTIMKRLAKENGVTVADVVDDGNIDSARIFFNKYKKIVAKPRDGMGGISTYVINSEEEFDDFSKYYSHECERYIFEEFIEGDFYHIDSITQKDEFIFHSVSRYLTPSSNLDFDKLTPFGSRMESQPEKVALLIETTEKVLSGLGAIDGVTHLEMFINKNGIPIFCEVGLRPGGGKIPHAIQLAKNININEAALKVELGEDVLLSGQTNMFTGFIGFRSCEGILEHTKLESLKFNWTANVALNYKIGSTVRRSSYCTDTVIDVIVFGHDSYDLENKLGQINRLFDTAITVIPHDSCEAY